MLLPIIVATLSMSPDTPGLALERSLSIPFHRELAFALAAVRPQGAGGHGDEQLEAVVFRGDPPSPTQIGRPRLSTTYDEGGLPRHAGIELWEDEEPDYPVRIGGEAVANGEIVHADGARTRVVLMAWHHNSHRTVGTYTLSTPPGSALAG